MKTTDKLSKRASLKAAELHKGQTYGDTTYMAGHLLKVASILIRQGWSSDEEMLAAAWLHDAIEDTEATYTSVKEGFGASVAEMVLAVSGGGGNRRERSGRKIRGVLLHQKALPLALADRIANVESCWRTRDRRLFMYHKEYRGFRAALYRPEEGDPRVTSLWGQLDALMGKEER